MVSILFTFLPIILIIFVIAIVIGAKGEKRKSKEGGEEMIKSVYVYLVLFATLMMTIGGSVAAFMNLAPPPYYQTFEEYKNWGAIERVKIDGTVEEVKMSDEELRAEYNSMVENRKVATIEGAKNNLVKSFGWILIPLPVFVYYQRKLTKKNEKEE